MRGIVASLAFVASLVACSAPPPAELPSSTSSASRPPQSRPPATNVHAAAAGAVPDRLPLERGVAVVVTGGGERRFKVELAVQDHERQRGLMYRDHLDDDEGMLFLFEEQTALSFWMKNTWIPLDMLFIDDDLTVAGIVENAEPMTTSSRNPGKPSRFVLEVRGGLSQELGLMAGQKVRFEGVPEALWQKQKVTTP